MTKATQTSRKTRASATRKKVWEPMAKLDVPEDKKDVEFTIGYDYFDNYDCNIKAK